MIDFAAMLERAERNVYEKAFKYYKLNQSATARSLKISRTTFITKMKKWGILCTVSSKVNEKVTFN